MLGEETQLLELRMQALQASEDSEVLHHAALLGNLSVIREYLDKYPNEVTMHVYPWECNVDGIVVHVHPCAIVLYVVYAHLQTYIYWQKRVLRIG